MNRPHTQPTTRMAAAVAVLAGAGLVLPVEVTLALVVILVVAVVGDRSLVPVAPTVSLQMPTRLTMGRRVHVPCTVTLPTGFRRIEHPSVEGLRIDTVAGGLDVTALRRGTHKVPGPIVISEGPLGLVQTATSVGGASVVKVYPPLAVPRAARRAPRQVAFESEEGHVLGPRGLGTAFDSLREYQPGDDVRLVNWRATARRDKVIVNQFRIELSRDVMIVVDAGQASAVGTGDVDGSRRIDAAVHAATAVAMLSDRLGDRVGAVVLGADVQRHLPPTQRAGGKVAGLLRDVEPDARAVAFDRLVPALPRKRSVVLVLTSLTDAGVNAHLTAVVRVLARRHAVLVVCPDELAGDRAVPAGGVAEVFTVAARAQLGHARAHAAAVLRRSGATVAFATAATLPAVACDLYARSAPGTRG